MSYKNNKFKDLSDHKRLVFIFIFISVLFCFLVIQFYKIQVIEGEKWTKEGLLQHQYTVVEPFMRGRFFSNTSIKPGYSMQPPAFVADVPKYHLFVDPYSIPGKYKNEVAEAIFNYIVCSETIKEKVVKDLNRKSRNRKLISWLEKKEKDHIEKWWQAFAKKQKIPKNALYFSLDYKRSHPFGPLLGQVLHTTQNDKDPYSFKSFPTGGLELFFDNYLQGKQGEKLVVRSLRHHLGTGKVLKHPENGSDIYLTINHYLQAVAEEELEKGIKKANGKGGWAIMMDPKTGEILVMAQKPSFDLDDFSKYFNNSKIMEETRVKAALDAFEPGSIFKPLTVAVCMKANEELEKLGKKPIFDPDEKIATSNGNFPGRPFPLKDGRLHYYLNMYMALQKSSNIYLGTIIQRVVNTLGDQWYRDTLCEMFSLGEKTKIELPAESSGLVPTIGKLHPNGRPEWSVSTPYSLAIGHNILVTSVQMLKCFAMIANEGVEVKPTLIRKIVKKEEDREIVILDNTKDEGLKKRILSKENARKLINAMKYVTKLGGSSRSADIMGYTEAGKSGTSEKIIDGKYSQTKYISFFVGFAPAHNPRFVLLIAIDEPEKKFIPGVGKNHHGGVSATPVFREIARRSLQYLGVAPDDPFGYPFGDPRRNPSKADWMKEVKELTELYKKWNEHESKKVVKRSSR